VDVLRIELLTDWGPERTRGEMQAAPHGRVGLGIESRHQYYAYYSVKAAEGQSPVKLRSDGTAWAVPVILEVSEEVWGTRRIGARLTVGILSDMRLEPDYDPYPGNQATSKHLETRIRVGIDLLAAVGSR
jgi:hypothetical protein